jgi:dihydroorotase-like cyclic amidohydrolase
MKADLAIQGGTVATPSGTFEADLLVQNGRIQAVDNVQGSCRR